MLWLHAIHLAGFLLAQVTNSTLLFLILKKGDKLFGSYRILMFSFALYSLIYAWIEIAAQPSICSSTIVFCAFNIYREIELAQHQMSQKNLDLNRQLFLTLSFQTLLPFLMMYIPIGLVIILPFFEVPLGKLANVAGISLAIYPALEPIAAIFCIKEFRRTVFFRNRRKVEASNQYSAPFTVQDTSCSVHQ
ncbi:hypothetical protein CAEBREN_23836 [Caenorhabditis brenneri]|uniref:Seven TM Receptor n=1 Tax=Caenorhabditis brenneri TaxID=135651 RepID=G0NWC0_CAEBE|nr:hypothetical protein CAEBREN_23836 [Caenorhabditis brenneri]